MQVAPHSEGKEVPGNDGWKFFHVVELVMLGQKYFYKRRDKYRSSVFKVNMGVKGIHICDRKGIDVLFDVNKVFKEPAFGRLRYNVCLLDGYLPSMFANDVPHDKQKTFLMQICRIAQKSRIFPTTVELTREYFRKWHNADPLLKASWERSIMDLISDIFTLSFFGIRVDSMCMYYFLKGSWAKGSALRRATESSCRVKKQLKKSPGFEELMRTAREAGISEDQALMDVLFMLNFNSYGGVSGGLRSCIARLSVLEEDYRQKMKDEIIKVLSEKGLTQHAFSEMPLLHNFVLEVLRMHAPVPIFFGRSREDFVLESSSGKFNVRKGQLLVGNVHMVHRDPSIFHRPEEFLPSRFEDKLLTDHILFGYGPLSRAATTRDHQCPGQDITINVLSVILSHFVLHCEFALTGDPIWTGKKLRRVGCPDQEMKLSYFRYSPTEACNQKIHVEDIPDTRSHIS